MKNKKNLKLFIGFLIKHKVYEQYLDALIKDRHYRESIGEQINPIYFIVSCIKNNCMGRLINCGFEWNKANYPNIDWVYISTQWDYCRISNLKKINYKIKNDTIRNL